MSVDNVEGAESTLIESYDSDQWSDSEQTKESQGRANHRAHFYGSSIERCSDIRAVSEQQQLSTHRPSLGGRIFNLKSKKDYNTTLLLALFLPGTGAHRFYVGKPLTGLLMFLTVGGGFGLWMLYDLYQIATGSFRDGEGRLIKP
ncbi:MAG: hypothetical protein K1060chlam2_00521 [Chlamydiae bacterium]|nr:hypothetical protein [Chlamydiota bacterium]